VPNQRKRSSSSVERAFEFLDLVAAAGTDGVKLSDLARASALPVSTCHRYITTLLDLGALSRDPSGRLFLGVRLVTLAGAALEGNSLRSVARDYLEQLSKVSGETVHLGMHTDQGVVYIDKIDSAKAVRLVSRVGSVVPHYCTAMGKAILAALPPAKREPFLAAASIKRTPKTLTGAKLATELEAVARRRWAIDEQELEDGVRCIGAAITTKTGELLGAVSVSGPAGRFTRQLCTELGPSVLAAADQIGQQSTWHNPIQ